MPIATIVCPAMVPVKETECEYEHEIDVRMVRAPYRGSYWEPSEPAEFDWDLPESCPECGTKYDEDHIKLMAMQMDAEEQDQYEEWCLPPDLDV